VNNLPFIDCNAERTEFSDECYGALGRALYVTQHLEANCRALAILMDVKKTITIGDIGSPDDPEFIEFVSKLWNRFLGKNLDVLRTYGFPEEVYSSLHEARKARNEVAHAITLGIEHKLEENLGRKEILDDIATAVKHIAEGDRIIGFLMQCVTNEPCPSSSYLHDYPDKVVEWVCETFDSP